MGTVVAQDVFQMKLDGIFPSVPGITEIADDMIIYEKDDEEIDRNFLNFLVVCRTNSLILNPDKIYF